MSAALKDDPRLAPLQWFASHARRDAYARRFFDKKKNDWGYNGPKHGALDDELLRKHINGGPHFGVYLLAPGSSKTAFAVLDLDDHEGSVSWDDMCAAALRLSSLAADKGLRAWPVRSGGGRGIHLFFIWDEPQDAAEVRRVLAAILHDAGLSEGSTGGLAAGKVEIFPKQDRVGADGSGNLIALPFGRESVPLDNNMQPATTIPMWLTSAPIRPQAETEKNDETSDNKSQEANALRDALKHLPSDDYNRWIEAAHALKHWHKTKGLAVWDEWSARSEKYPGKENIAQHWKNLKPRGDVTIGTIFYWAREAGWKGTIPKQKSSAAELLITIIDRATLFHTAEGSAQSAYADVEVNGHRETLPVHSRSFRDWIVREYFKTTRSVPPEPALRSVIAVTEAKARFNAEERSVFLRVATCGGRLYLDLCDDQWRAVEIDAEGWRIVARPPVRFRRAAGMLALPEPVPGGSIDELRPFLNADDQDFILTVGWLLGSLSGRGPYAILVVSGEQGAAKTTYSKMLRSLIDPNKVPARALLRHDHDLYIAAHNAHMAVFDNISKLAEWLSDTLCRLATGGGFSARTLYTDADEMLFDGICPVILNGIENFVERPDLADRVILLTLRAISEEARRPEKELWSAFEAARPRILGALLDAASVGLRELPDTSLAAMPRMADFALWVAACENALRWEPGTFEKAYADNRQTGQIDLLDVDPVGTAIQKLSSETMMEETPNGLFQPVDHQQPFTWRGSATELLDQLNKGDGTWGYSTEQIRRDRRWPKNPRELTNRLRRMVPALRQAGINVEFRTSHGKKLIEITRQSRDSDGGCP